jgi:hypothetical protein
MKKLMQITLLLLIPTGMLFAQQTGSNAPDKNMQKIQAQNHQMARELQLSPDQESQLFRINVDYYKQMDSYNGISSNFTAEEKQNTLKNINDKRMDALKNVLTIAQIELFKKKYSDTK